MNTLPPSAVQSSAWQPLPPLVAILRGLEPERARAVGDVLVDAGFRALEVPLNRPGALACIAALAPLAGRGAVVGAGTVVTPTQVDEVAAAGGTLIVSPHTDPAVLAHGKARRMILVPGVFTASEAMLALREGAHALKIFPAEAMPYAGLKSLASILPEGTPLWPVGGITPESLPVWWAHGANGFGIGSALFKPGVSLAELAARAQAFVQAWHQLGRRSAA
jgi:2-dehydro-3-deoxyphosphogalactonate aldolase